MNQVVNIIPKRCVNCIPETCFQTGNKHCTCYPFHQNNRKPTGERINLKDGK